MNDFRYSDAGLALTRSFEGLRLMAYQDVAGVWTIGYGHTGKDVRSGLAIDEAQAVALLRADVASAQTFVNHVVTVPLVQCQFDALVDFCFNVGCGHLLHSTLLVHLNAGIADTAERFLDWSYAGGQQVAGLLRRRQAEAAMWMGKGLNGTI